MRLRTRAIYDTLAAFSLVLAWLCLCCLILSAVVGMAWSIPYWGAGIAVFGGAAFALMIKLGGA